MFFDGTGWRHLRIAYDGQALIAEYNASNALLRRYVHGPGTDEPIVWYEGSDTSDRRWLHSDERGSIVAISNGAGTALSTNSYDDYGISASTNTGRFQYTGQTWLPELGMFYYKARIYSPTLGRFMQTDPIGYADGLNWYAYVGNDPVNRRDPTGLAEVRVCSREQWNGGAEGYDGEDKCISPHEDIVVVGNPDRDNHIIINPAIRINPGMIDYASIFSTGANGGATATPQNDTIVVTAEKVDLRECMLAIGGAGLEGFIDPLSIVAGAGKSIYEAHERIGDGDYGRRLDGSRFPRTWGHAARIGMRRFIPGYLQASLIVGGVKATFELFSNSSCGLSE